MDASVIRAADAGVVGVKADLARDSHGTRRIRGMVVGQMLHAMLRFSRVVGDHLVFTADAEGNAPRGCPEPEAASRENPIS
jgi:hypothetical protein